MALPLLCALVYLLLSVRILVDGRIDISDVRQGVRIAFRAWGVSVCLDMPIRMPKRRPGAKETAAKAKRAWPFVKAVIHAIRWGQTDLHLRAGTQDAALTAMIVGAFGALCAALQTIACQYFPCETETIPVYSGQCFSLSGRCIFSFIPGDIMFAVAKAAIKTTRKEGFSWLSIPLKA